MSAIFVSSASLDFFLNTSTFDLANTVFAQKLTYKHNSYGPDDIQSLEQVLEDRRRRSKPVCKIQLVIGLPNVSIFSIFGLQLFSMIYACVYFWTHNEHPLQQKECATKLMLYRAKKILNDVFFTLNYYPFLHTNKAIKLLL